MRHNKVQSTTSAQGAENSRRCDNLQPIVNTFAAMPVAPKRFLTEQALRLMLEGYGEISKDSGPGSSLCLFNSQLLFICFIFFLLIAQMFEGNCLV